MVSTQKTWDASESRNIESKIKLTERCCKNGTRKEHPVDRIQFSLQSILTTPNLTLPWKIQKKFH